MEEVKQDTQQGFGEQAAPVVDTPSNAFTEDAGSEGPMSFEDVIFGPEGERKEAEAPPRTPEQVAADTVATENAPNAQEEYQAKNDEKRFEYWQSQAAQLQNELEKSRQATESLGQYVQQTQEAPRYTSAGPQAATPQQAVEEVDEGFPPAPERPLKPRNFSREAAYTDPTSESAAYLDAVDDWRDDMDEYNSLRAEYDQAKMEEYVQEQEGQRQEAVQRQQMAAEQQRQIGEIDKFVQGQYGFTPEESQEFIATYSDPKSVTMENLVQLYRLNKGQSINMETQAAPQQAPPVPVQQPSPTFQQQQRAQQIPSPMGVQSGVGNSNPEDGLPAGQKFMDALIGNHNKNTAF
jgi:hypothetical protein